MGQNSFVIYEGAQVVDNRAICSLYTRALVAIDQRENVFYPNHASSWAVVSECNSEPGSL